MQRWATLICSCQSTKILRRIRARAFSCRFPRRFKSRRRVGMTRRRASQTLYWPLRTRQGYLLCLGLQSSVDRPKLRITRIRKMTLWIRMHCLGSHHSNRLQGRVTSLEWDQLFRLQATMSRSMAMMMEALIWANQTCLSHLCTSDSSIRARRLSLSWVKILASSKLIWRARRVSRRMIARRLLWLKRKFKFWMTRTIKNQTLMKLQN